MSDLEIRAQKRAGPALRQEIRIGELELRRVQLAAWLGYGPALEAAEGVGPDVPATEPAGDSSRVRQVLQWGGLPKPMLVGLACDMAERVAHGLEGEIAIKAARDWLACPCEGHRQAAAYELEPVGEVWLDLCLARRDIPLDSPEASAVRAEESAARAALAAGDAAVAEDAEDLAPGVGACADTEDDEVEDTEEQAPGAEGRADIEEDEVDYTEEQAPGAEGRAGIEEDEVEDNWLSAGEAADATARASKQAATWTAWTQVVLAATAAAERAGQAGAEAGARAAEARAAVAEATERAAELEIAAEAASEAAEAAQQAADGTEAVDRAAKSAAEYVTQSRVAAERAAEEAARAAEAAECVIEVVERAVEEHKHVARAAERVVEEYGQRLEAGTSPGAAAEAAMAAGKREEEWQANRVAEVLCSVGVLP